MSICLVGNYNDVVAANQQIELNAGIPNHDTVCWDVPKQAYQQAFWYIHKPDPQGWNNYSQEQMMANVVDVNEMEFDSNWIEPIEAI